VNRHVLAGELEGNYISSNLQGSVVGSKLADFCNTASVRSRQYVLVRGSSEGWCRRSETTIPTNAAGYRKLVTWADSLGTVEGFGVEGTGSYGAGLARHLRGGDHRVVEVHRPNRQA